MIPMRSAGLGCLSRQVKPRIGCFNQFQPASVWAAFARSEKRFIDRHAKPVGRSNEIDAFASYQVRVDPKLDPATPDANGKEIHGVIKR